MLLEFNLQSHSCGFKFTCQKFLRGQLQQHKEYLLPFHLPSVQVAAGKKESIKDVLFNHLKVHKSWSWTAPPQCPCKQFAQEHPNLRTVHGHVASPAYLLNVSRRLCELLKYSASTEFSPCHDIAELQ